MKLADGCVDLVAVVLDADVIGDLRAGGDTSLRLGFLPDGRRVYSLRMTEAQQGEARTTTPDAAVPRRNSYVAPLLVVGVLVAVGGLIGGLVAKAFADHASLVANSAKVLVSCGSDPIPLCFPKTLGYPLVTADYTGLWIGILIAVLGVMVLLAGSIIASARPRVA